METIARRGPPFAGAVWGVYGFRVQGHWGVGFRGVGFGV